MKKTPAVITVIIVILLLGIIIYLYYYMMFVIKAYDRKVEQPLIGGDRDEHGCLGAAGYSFDEEIGVCIRPWELDDAQREIAKASVESMGECKPLTVVSVEEDNICENCYKVRYDVLQQFFTVWVQDGKVVGVFEETRNIALNGADFTSYRELVFKLAISVLEKDVSTLVLLDIPVRWNISEGEKLEYEGKGAVYDGPYRSQEVVDMQRALLNRFEELGFETDDYNEVPGQADFDIRRLRNQGYICNVMLSGDFEGGKSRVQFACVEVPQN